MHLNLFLQRESRADPSRGARAIPGQRVVVMRSATGSAIRRLGETLSGYAGHWGGKPVPGSDYTRSREYHVPGQVGPGRHAGRPGKP